jgi:hypothetical protein
MYNFTVAIAHTYAVGSGQWLVHNACGPYSSTGGHHIHAQSAFQDNPNYSSGRALSISQADLQANGWNHQAMTNTQNQLFRQLGADVANGTAKNTMLAHNQIAVQSLQAGGVPYNQARQYVAQSLWNLREQNVRYPTNIPWVGSNTGSYR